MYKNKLFKNTVFLIAGVFLFLLLAAGLQAQETAIDGCAAPVTSPNYSTTFDTTDFNISDVLLNANGDLVLDTQRKVLDPNNIEIPIEQQVSVAFLYENAGYNKTRFGWMYETDVLSTDSSKPDPSKIRWVYDNISDNNTDGNGIINYTQPNGINYDDGEDHNGDGVVNALDDEIALYEVDSNGDPAEVDDDDIPVPITFPAGTKLVFVLDSSENDERGGIFYTKKAWNESLTRCENSTISTITSFTRLIKLYENFVEGGDVGKCDSANFIAVDQQCVEWKSNGGCETYVDVMGPDPANPISQGWLDADAVTRLAGLGYIFNASTENEVLYSVDYNASAVHAILAAPSNADNAWILAFDDQRHDMSDNPLTTDKLNDPVADMDFNDLVFLIKRKTGGVVQLKNNEVISPTDSDAYYTELEFEVYDGLPCSGGSSITYSYSVNFVKDKDDDSKYLDAEGNIIDQTETGWEEKKVPIWHDILDSQWEQIYSFTKNGAADLASGQPDMTGEFDNQSDMTNSDVNLALSGWKPGTPTYTGRKVSIDMIEVGEIGRDLIWKATLNSDDENCAPIIYNVSIDTTVAKHAIFSRSQPIILANVTYSGSYETPDLTDSVWRKTQELRGHFKAFKVYDPATAVASDSDGAKIWDAGQKLSDRNLTQTPRTIYFPAITVSSKHTESLVSSANGTTTTFSGTLINKPVMDGTLVIKATTVDAGGVVREVILNDLYSDDVLVTTGSASGSVDRFTGAYSLIFNDPPKASSAITATYYSYTPSTTLQTLTSTSASEALLNIADETDITQAGLNNWILGFDGNSERVWPLGAIDHSSPAIMTPPNLPGWYDTTALSDSVKESFYDPDEDEDTSNPACFYYRQKERNTVAFVGSMGGLLHAFDAGKYRRGDNPETEKPLVEIRGYFEWSGDTSDTAQYGTGDELWAYIPGNLMPKMKNNYSRNGDSKAYVDGSPSLADVYTNNAWRTVLIFAQGVGGHAVTCLDVTTPSSPALLWEYENSSLLNSKSSPAIGLVKTSSGTAKWACFLVSGSTDATSHPKIFMLDVETGTLIGTGIELDAAGDSGLGGVGGGQPALIDTDGDGFIDRLYIGTDKGYMYRVTLTNTTSYSDEVINSGEQDASKGIYAGPTVLAVENEDGDLDGTVRVFFGTGGSGDSDTTYTFYAYVDDGSNPTLDWSYDLPAGMRVFTSAFASAGIIYFGATSAITEDPCEAGGINNSKIYAFNYTLAEGTSTAEPVAEITLPTGSGRVTPVVDDNHLYVKTVEGSLLSYGGADYNNDAEKFAEDTPAETSIQSWREVDPNEE